MTTETTGAEQSEQEKQAQAKLEREESEKGFAAGFTKVRGGEADKAEDKTEDTTAAVAAAEVAADKTEKTEAAQAAKDPWEGVSPVVRQHLEQLTGGVKEAVQAAKSAAGRVSALQSAIDAGKAAAAKTGADAPSDRQVQAALSNPDAWKKFKEEFPEFAAPVEAELGALRVELAKKGGTAVNVEEINAQVEERVQSRLQTARAELRAELREVSKVDAKHPEWETTVKTDEFRTWTLAGGPSNERYSQMKALERTDPAKADAMVHEFARAHPKWWADKGAALFGTTSKDAITLLDGYAEHQKAAATTVEKKAKDQKRLGAAVPAKGTPASATTALPDERGLEIGFKRARGK